MDSTMIFALPFLNREVTHHELLALKVYSVNAVPGNDHSSLWEACDHILKTATVLGRHVVITQSDDLDAIQSSQDVPDELRVHAGSHGKVTKKEHFVVLIDTAVPSLNESFIHCMDRRKRSITILDNVDMPEMGVTRNENTIHRSTKSLFLHGRTTRIQSIATPWCLRFPDHQWLRT